MDLAVEVAQPAEHLQEATHLQVRLEVAAEALPTRLDQEADLVTEALLLLAEAAVPQEVQQASLLLEATALEPLQAEEAVLQEAQQASLLLEAAKANLELLQAKVPADLRKDFKAKAADKIMVHFPVPVSN